MPQTLLASPKAQPPQDPEAPSSSQSPRSRGGQISDARRAQGLWEDAQQGPSLIVTISVSKLWA